VTRSVGDELDQLAMRQAVRARTLTVEDIADRLDYLQVRALRAAANIVAFPEVPARQNRFERPMFASNEGTEAAPVEAKPREVTGTTGGRLALLLALLLLLLVLLLLWWLWRRRRKDEEEDEDEVPAPAAYEDVSALH